MTKGKVFASAAGSAFPGINRQPDTFHAISHRLGKWINSLERSAYAAIENEYHCMEVFGSAKTEQVIQKRMDAYFDAKTNTDKTIMLYEIYKFLYHCIIDNRLSKTSLKKVFNLMLSRRFHWHGNIKKTRSKPKNLRGENILQPKKKNN